MGMKKCAVGALLVAAAIEIAAATAHGSPAAVGSSISGSDHGIAYTAAWSPDYLTAAKTLDSGRFVVTPDAGAVDAADGTVLGEVPMSAEVDPIGSTLAVERPVGLSAGQSAPVALEDVAAGGLVIGVMFGCVIGGSIGLLFLLVGAVPGCIAGGIIGGVVGTVVPFP
ncbi:hypothetical protein [Nocardia sp. NPDC051570]|uniref:hypothetical protein n=1 Tax=Nocardia sp. NPDC051570 TaxID=3364324 RepID=UPI0037B92B80